MHPDELVQIHYVSGWSANEHLKKCGMTRRVVDFDLHTVGPAPLDPKQHLRARMKFWEGADVPPKWPWDKAKQLRLDVKQFKIEMPKRGPIMLWTSRRFNDQLSFYRACFLFGNRELDLAELKTEGVFAATEKQIHDTCMYAWPIKPERLKDGQEKWRAFCSPDWKNFSSLLKPRERRIYEAQIPLEGLSRFDRLLLRGLDKSSWTTPKELLKHGLQEAMDLLDEWQVIARLKKWSKAGVIEARKGPGKALFTQVAFRLLQKPTPENAPKLLLGGSVHY